MTLDNEDVERIAQRVAELLAARLEAMFQAGRAAAGPANDNAPPAPAGKYATRMVKPRPLSQIPMAAQLKALEVMRKKGLL